ncbi:TRAP transporter permease [Polymorphum gilvum]|uniref:TRAP transporter, 4TM/12TM fusion protein n=1 Tax=Polymorphum gilvum (strain LMG 25793 / CGMCC 1.9160 / SL003B-26A1) TaxID=991905 RepID=F2J6M6_POLGS|nr:TRAP transporter fused permease subunit [Polymorphum gilvum]ADZ72509.1 TRAP transporter, 4TM/12TM fusion protein [Polymorphum gilvum SL003B-26A1]
MTQASRVRPSSVRPAVVQGLSVVLTLIAIAFALDLPSRLGLRIYTEQVLAAALGVGLALVFLIERRGSDGNERPVAGQMIDWMLAALGLGASAYVSFHYADLVGRAMSVAADVVTIAAILFLLVLEGLRRVVGWPLVLVVLGIAGYGLLGHLVPGSLQTRHVAAEQLLTYVAFDVNGILGLTLNVAVTVVIAFVLFGQILMRAGGAEFFNDISLAALGRRRGGAAKISILASALFGTISGVVVSNIVATGVVTIRLMIRSGYRAPMAAAVEAVASTGGQIAPPVMGAVAFLMADFLQVPYAEIALAAVIPAALYYLALYFQVDLEAAASGIAPLSEETIPSAGRTLRRGGILILPFLVMVGALFWMGQRPETAALWATAVALICGAAFGYGGQRIAPRAIWQSLVETGFAMTDILMISAGAGIIIGVLNITGLGFAGTFALAEIGEGNLFLLLVLTAIASLILGMGMPTVAVYLLLAVLLAPPLVEAGVSPVAAHFFIFYLGMMSMVTPPIAIGAFFAAALAKAPPMQTSLIAMRLGWTAYVVPFLFVVSPPLLMQGSAVEIVTTAGAAMCGVYAISAAAARWFGGPIDNLQRMFLALSGVLLLLPIAPGGFPVAAAHGLGLAMLAAFWLLRRMFAASPEPKQTRQEP